MATPVYRKAEGTAGERTIVMMKSASRPGVEHRVYIGREIEHDYCSCESRTRCWHIEYQRCPWCSGYGTQDPSKTYPRLVACEACNGTGRAA
jgi:DnaJ-class molecular chaperone